MKARVSATTRHLRIRGMVVVRGGEEEGRVSDRRERASMLNTYGPYCYEQNDEWNSKNKSPSLQFQCSLRMGNGRSVGSSYTSR
jgi:hypothetical protein